MNLHWKKPSSLLLLLTILVYWPLSAPADVSFKEAAVEAGLAYPHSALTAKLLDDLGDLAIMSGGGAAGDFDNDGWMDLYVTRINLPNQLFRNKGDGSFEEMGAAAGVNLLSASAGSVWADIDNDGDQDLYVLTFETRNYLYINDGSGHFQEQAKARNVDLEGELAVHVSTSAAFGDVDNDGDLDLLATAWQSRAAARVNSQTRLFINDGQGNFSDNTLGAGLTEPIVGFSPAFADVDQDGWQDILIVGDFGSSVYFHNEGDGIFVNQTEQAGVGTDENGMGSAIFDIDNDGDQDWFVSSIYDPTECEYATSCSWRFTGNRLYLNDGKGRFEDATDKWKIRDGGWGWGASGLDFDNDSDVDLILANGINFGVINVADQFKNDALRVWQNNGRSMTEIATKAGVFAFGVTTGVVVFDYDNDGDQDFFVSQNKRIPFLFKNVSSDSGHWFRVRLEGTRSNRDGTGAIVRLTTNDGRVLTRFAGNNSNYNSHNEPIVHFGLGEASSVAALEVEWPASGWVQRFTDLKVDQVFSIKEAEQKVVIPANDSITRGLYWDRSRSGHGFDFQRYGDNWFALLYTYRTDNTPLWYLALGEVNDGVYTGEATQFDYDPSRSPSQQAIAGTGGEITVDFAADPDASEYACDDGMERDDALSTAILSFDLDGQQGQWCVEPVNFAKGTPAPDFTGSWYSSEDPGWGMTIATQGTGTKMSLAVVLYFYDDDQQPRWALGSASNVDLGSEVSVGMRQFSGFCLSCEPRELESAAVGSVRLTLLAPSDDGSAGNMVSIDIDYSGAPGGTWLRADEPIQLLSDPYH